MRMRWFAGCFLVMALGLAGCRPRWRRWSQLRPRTRRLTWATRSTFPWPTGSNCRGRNWPSWSRSGRRRCAKQQETARSRHRIGAAAAAAASAGRRRRVRRGALRAGRRLQPAALPEGRAEGCGRRSAPGPLRRPRGRPEAGRRRRCGSAGQDRRLPRRAATIRSNGRGWSAWSCKTRSSSWPTANRTERRSWCSCTASCALSSMPRRPPVRSARRCCRVDGRR